MNPMRGDLPASSTSQRELGQSTKSVLSKHRSPPGHARPSGGRRDGGYHASRGPRIGLPASPILALRVLELWPDRGRRKGVLQQSQPHLSRSVSSTDGGRSAPLLFDFRQAARPEPNLCRWGGCAGVRFRCIDLPVSIGAVVRTKPNAFVRCHGPSGSWSCSRDRPGVPWTRWLSVVAGAMNPVH